MPNDNETPSAERTQTTGSNIMSNALGSAAAGIVGRTCTHPLDTVKARLQAPQNITAYRGPADVMAHTLRTEGLRGLYRGFGTVIVGGIPGTMLYLCSYDIAKEKLAAATSKDSGHSMQQQQAGFMVHFCAGLLAETIACIIYVPVDVIKERLQVQQSNATGNLGTNITLKNPPTNPKVAAAPLSPVYKGGWDALKTILKYEGIRGIYIGYGATLASFGPFSALYFVFYEKSKEYARQQHRLDSEKDLPFTSIIASSAGAGALASWLTSPLDMAKLRLQVQRGASSAAMIASSSSSSSKSSGTTATAVQPQYRTVVDCLRHTYQQVGVKGLFRGAGARVLHFAPATTITMTCFETFRKFFEQNIVW